MARIERPAAPVLDPPDIGASLAPVSGVQPGAAIDGALITLDPVTRAPSARLQECRIREGSVSQIELDGAVLVDVAVERLSAVSITSRDSRLRRVLFSGGRIGSLDLSRADLSCVRLQDLRIDYLSLAGATLADVEIRRCTIGTLDLPHARASRVRADDSRADEVDTREVRAEDVDLRGLEAARFLDYTALRGCTFTPWQVEQHAGGLAAALGIDVRP